MLKNTRERFGAVAQGFHWLIALAFIAMLAIGLYMTSLPFSNSLTFPLYQFHKALGITILVVVVFRVLWRLWNVQPALPGGLKLYEQLLARVTHYGLYVALFLMPISGWVMVSASTLPIKTMIFGLFELPKIGFIAASPHKNAIHEFAEGLHGTVAWIAIALLVLHVGASLKHHFVLKDNVLRRMVPGMRLRPPSA